MTLRRQSSRRGASGAPPEGDDESWMALYNDLVSILLGFFVLMYAASAIDRVKYEKISSSLAESLGGKPVQITPIEVVGFDFDEVLRLLVRHIEQSQLADHITLTKTHRGIELSTDSELMFPSGQADLSPRAQALLGSFADLIRGYACNILVEGHTDDLPIRSRVYPSNWELSSARASSVVRFLIDQRIDERRLIAVGRASTKPLPGVQRDDAERGDVRRRSRRVVLILTPQDQDDVLRMGDAEGTEALPDAPRTVPPAAGSAEGDNAPAP